MNGCVTARIGGVLSANAGNILLTFRVQVERRNVYDGEDAGAPARFTAEMSTSMAELEEPLRVPAKSDKGKFATRWLFLLFCAAVWVIGAIWFFS